MSDVTRNIVPECVCARSSDCADALQYTASWQGNGSSVSLTLVQGNETHALLKTGFTDSFFSSLQSSLTSILQTSVGLAITAQADSILAAGYGGSAPISSIQCDVAITLYPTYSLSGCAGQSSPLPADGIQLWVAGSTWERVPAGMEE